MEYHISELMWKKIFNFLKNCSGIYAYDEYEMRIFIEAVWFISSILTPGQRNEITQAENLIQNIQNTIVIADKDYDSNVFLEK